MTIRVVLADDHSVVRAGIRVMLSRIPGIQILGEASNGREALELVERLQPHLLLADIGMPEMNGLELTARVTKDFPNVRVLILSVHATEEYVWQALRAGAAGYLLKNMEANELEQAIQAVIDGKMYLTSAVSQEVVASYMDRLGNGANVLDILTPRQREILQLIAEGRSTKEIAQRLSISVKTVETHRGKLMERLQIYDVPGLVRFAVRMGLVSPLS
jgi:DNA-binding NarL/FixJ family response regulator